VTHPGNWGPTCANSVFFQITEIFYKVTTKVTAKFSRFPSLLFFLTATAFIHPSIYFHFLSLTQHKGPYVFSWHSFSAEGRLPLVDKRSNNTGFCFGENNNNETFSIFHLLSFPSPFSGLRK